MRKIAWLFGLVFLFWGCFDAERKSAEVRQPLFLQKIEALKEGKIDSLALGEFVDRIKSRPLYEGSEIDETDRDLLQDSSVAAENLEPVKKEDILLVTQKYILLLVRDKPEITGADKTRLLSITPDAKVLDMVLLHMQEGNNEYKISRSFDYFKNIPYRFNAKTRRFELTDFRYDTEWITPTKGEDVVAYKTKIVLGVDAEGRFKLIEKVELPHTLDE